MQVSARDEIDGLLEAGTGRFATVAASAPGRFEIASCARELLL